MGGGKAAPNHSGRMPDEADTLVWGIHRTGSGKADASDRPNVKSKKRMSKGVPAQLSCNRVKVRSSSWRDIVVQWFMYTSLEYELGLYKLK